MNKTKTLELLTPKEKDAIRNAPCGMCKAIPILENGERCHPHRVIHGSNGGLYTEANTGPRCPSCHDVEHGGDGTTPFLGAAAEGGHKGGRKGGLALARNSTREQRQARGKRASLASARATKKLTPEQRRERAKKAAYTLAKNTTPEQRRVWAQMGARTLYENSTLKQRQAWGHTSARKSTRAQQQAWGRRGASYGWKGGRPKNN